MIKSLDYFLSIWNLSGPTLIETTKMCSVYTVLTTDGDMCALKVMNDIGMRFESDSADWFSYINGCGAARLYKSEYNGLLMEYLEGEELAALVFDERDDEAMDIALSVVHEIHSNQSQKKHPNYQSLKEHFACLFDTDFEHELLKPAQDLTRTLLNTQKDKDIRVLHADIHHKNILKSARGWLAIDPQKAIGDRHYEVANLFRNPEGFDGIFDIARMDQLEIKAVQVLCLDILRVRQFAFAHAMLSTCWHKLDNEDATLSLTIADIIHKRLNS